MEGQGQRVWELGTVRNSAVRCGAEERKKKKTEEREERRGRG
jgi:hypothetical protein